ncbi:GatB/YqeY domain-containing protein [Marinoscillum sp. MHG1-6]|uniref:GatB/YqeY domain-containing protein n=1 Tax=Marinoscillum sp. MHG1-6 TaxID=2959627 RepID=UPI002157780D|nr:GatB/YqeY domain-containing protein [Marinoscillum sp. MHG1-6]
MSLKAKIEGEIKQAMLNKNKERLTALRSIKSSILLAETEKGGSGDLSEDTELKLLMKAAKQRKDSIDVFEEQGRDDLAQKEKGELEVIEEFLPKQMSEAEVEAAVKQVIDEVGAAGPQDMGKVMGAATKKLAGQAEGKMISMLAKKLLS